MTASQTHRVKLSVKLHLCLYSVPFLIGKTARYYLCAVLSDFHYLLIQGSFKQCFVHMVSERGLGCHPCARPCALLLDGVSKSATCCQSEMHQGKRAPEVPVLHSLLQAPTCVHPSVGVLTRTCISDQHVALPLPPPRLSACLAAGSHPEQGSAQQETILSNRLSRKAEVSGFTCG